MRSWGISIAVLGASLAGEQALAQVPPSASPDRLDERFKLPEIPKSAPKQPLPQAQSVAPSAQALETQFTLASVSVDGATVC